MHMGCQQSKTGFYFTTGRSGGTSKEAINPDFYGWKPHLSVYSFSLS